MISVVAASETETAQTEYMLKPGSVVYSGSWGLIGQISGSVGKLQSGFIDKASGKAHHRG